MHCLAEMDGNTIVALSSIFARTHIECATLFQFWIYRYLNGRILYSLSTREFVFVLDTTLELAVARCAVDAFVATAAVASFLLFKE